MKYFHMRAIMKRKAIKIEGLKLRGEEWCFDEQELKKYVVGFFHDFYSSLDQGSRPKLPNCFPLIEDNCLWSLATTVTKDKVHKALWDMAPYKALGPDGFQACFYQSNWELMEVQVVELIRSILDGRSMPLELNRTLLVLIPKIPNPETIHNFRPISLCNVAYKLVTKTISNRLRPLMPSWIAPNQSSFVPNRHIQDNIIVAQELIHIMKKLRRRRVLWQ